MLKRRKQVEHHAAVYDTQPIPGDATQFEPYFIAMCDCEWIGPARQSGDVAFKDAYAHTDDVETEMKRPVG